jgi:transcriptional regulator with XRE-family HTH domain
MRGNYFYERLGEKIYIYRKKRKLSQEELGLLCDVDRTYIARIEEGKANPTIKVVAKISKSLKVRMSKLLKGV